jgi:hypothetical protein
MPEDTTMTEVYVTDGTTAEDKRITDAGAALRTAVDILACHDWEHLSAISEETQAIGEELVPDWYSDHAPVIAANHQLFRSTARYLAEIRATVANAKQPDAEEIPA